MSTLPGSCIDFFVLSEALGLAVSRSPHVSTDVALFPHRPVLMALEYPEEDVFVSRAPARTSASPTPVFGPHGLCRQEVWELWDADFAAFWAKYNPDSARPHMLHPVPDGYLEGLSALIHRWKDEAYWEAQALFGMEAPPAQSRDLRSVALASLLRRKPCPRLSNLGEGTHSRALSLPHAWGPKGQA